MRIQKIDGKVNTAIKIVGKNCVWTDMHKYSNYFVEYNEPIYRFSWRNDPFCTGQRFFYDVR